MSTPAGPSPMKAIPGDLPRGDQWVYELKWDGMRAVVANGAEGIVATSARGTRIDASFPELDALHDHLGDLDVVLDGEIVAFDETGRPSFGTLQRRMHVADRERARRLAREVPVSLVVFDLLRLDGHDTTSLAWHQRRDLLERLVEPGRTWRLTTVHTGDPGPLLDVVGDQGMEGVVAKRRNSPYRPGTRSPDWVKAKVRRHQELVVGGWLGRGDTDAGVGSLLVGHHDERGLRYAGRVGSGIGADDERRLADLLEPLRRPDSPFVDTVPRVPRRTPRWADPELVVEIAYGEWTADGQLRHPVWLGIRTDVDPTAVSRED